MPCVEGKTRYSVEGKKLEVPLSKEEFDYGVTKGKFCKKKHKAFAVLLYYSGLRKTELRRAKREQFSEESGRLIFAVGKRLKHGKETESLQFPLSLPYMSLVMDAINSTKKTAKVFDFSDRTAYNVIRRVWHYPHHFRLTRITKEFQKGRTIPEMKNFTGLTLQALDSYVGKVSI